MTTKTILKSEAIGNYSIQYVPGTDYFWFISSLLEARSKDFNVEIMDDRTGDNDDYKIKEVILEYIPGQEGKCDSIQVLAESITTKKFALIELNEISDVRENGNSLPGSFYKYYTYSKSGDYRFVIRCKEKA